MYMKILKYISILVVMLCLPILSSCGEEKLYSDMTDITTETIGLYHVDDADLVASTFPEAMS